MISKLIPYLNVELYPKRLFTGNFTIEEGASLCKYRDFKPESR